MNQVTTITSKNEQYEVADAKAREEKLNIDDMPTKLSQFRNDVGFIDKTVSNLVNYYTKTQTYSKEEINDILTARLSIEVVQVLPTEDISTSTIYLVRKTDVQDNDVYDEYIWVNNAWELIGNTAVDLTNYYTKSEAETMAQNKVDAETDDRQTADSNLSGRIDNVQTSLTTLNNTVANEISTRSQSDTEFRGGISDLEIALDSEISRAESVESELSESISDFENHVENTNNPHSVTKAQVGLGNVANVATDDTIIQNSSNNVTGGAVYDALQNKVDKVSGKGLSDQNYTLTEKTKLAGLNNYDDTAISNRVTATENAITTLNGDSSTSGSVDKKIADAIAGVTQIDFQIVQTLPQTGVKGVIYFVVDTLGQENVYNEYVWINNTWELIGQTTSKIDLSDYYTKAQTNALVSAKNDKITVTDVTSETLTDSSTFADTTNSAGANPTNITKRPLSLLWNYIEAKIADMGIGSDTYAGNSATATKLKNARTINIQDSDGTNTGTGASFDGSANATIKLPATIKVNITGNCSGTSGYASKLGTSSAYHTKATIDTALGNKVDKVSGKGLSTNDFTTTDKTAIRYYGTCSTSRADVAKIVSCTNFVLEAGAKIVVKFTDTAGSAPTTGNMTMNVNSTGAKNVYNKNNAQMTYAHSGEFRNNRYCEFVYDGTSFIWLNYDSNTTYSTITQAEITTGTSTSARLVTPKLLNDNFVKKESGKGLFSGSYNDLTNKPEVVSKASAGFCPQLPNETTTTKYLRQDGTWVAPPNTTYSNATTSADGLMSSSDKSKLDGIESGAQVNTITGVKGNGETTYRTGNVNITPANIGLGNVNNTADSNKAVASAGKLTTARKVYVKLGTASTTETKDFSGDTAIPVNGTLGAGNGGTGKTSLKDSANALINALDTGSSTPVDNDYYVSQYVGGGTTTTTFHRRPMSALWNYIKGKLSVTTSGNGNAITGLSYSNGVFTATKGSTFLTSHQDISGKVDKSDDSAFKYYGNPNGTTKYITITFDNTYGGILITTGYSSNIFFESNKGTPYSFNSSTNYGVTGYAWASDGKTLYLRVSGYRPIAVTIPSLKRNQIGSAVTFADASTTAPSGVTFVNTTNQIDTVSNRNSAINNLKNTELGGITFELIV